MNHRKNKQWLKLGLLIGGFALAGIVFLAISFAGPAGAQQLLVMRSVTGELPSTVPSMAAAFAQGDEPVHPPVDTACRLCHGDSSSVVEFPSGESLPVVVDLEGLSQSAHGNQADIPLVCVDCHPPAGYQFPHEPLEANDLRSFQLEQAQNCQRCHQQPHITGHPGPESDNPVVCSDCHESHEVLTVEQWQSGQGTEACVDCHLDSGVEITDPFALTEIVRGRLFTDKVDSDYCLACHSQPDLTMTFENGDELSLTIDANALHNSVHGADNPWQALECTDCHENYKFPHEPLEVASAREFALQRYTNCVKCHEKNYEKSLDSVHGAALEEGNIEAAVCTDCHGAHDTPAPDEPRELISHTCQQCHSTIFDAYAQSVHGEALLEDSNDDVAVCIDCHGVHDINEPTNALARNRSPELCANCHADEALMAEYDISTDVFDTYVADFHGTTVALFEHQDPDLETNKAVCYDCHGVHDIRPVDDLESGIKVNLLETCQECHPTATENFPDAWTSHYRPSLQNNPLVFLVDSFYAIVIPVTLAGLVFLIATDIFGKVRRRWKK